MKCADCSKWITAKKNVYGDGSEIETYRTEPGTGHCNELNITTKAAFGCSAFAAGCGDEVTHKDGSPWQHFIMIPCPDCAGKGDGARGHRCAGTGLVRKYDDGYIGDEQTRKHPKEKEVKPAEQPVSGLIVPESGKASVLAG